MKKIVLYISLFTLVLCSCQKEEIDEIFDQSPEERVSEQLNAVRTDLMSNEMGWLSTYTFAEGKEELVLIIKFIDDDRAEISAPELGMKQESSYTLRYTQQIDLVFDTHSFLAWLVDNGYKADFRWELDKQEDGQYFFTSRAASNEGESVLVLDKASPEKLTYALKIQELKSYLRKDASKSFFRNLVLSTGEVFDYSYVNNKVIFKYLLDGEIVCFESEITLNDNGFKLDNPFVVDGKSIADFEYDSTTGNFKIINSDGIDGGINYDIAPAYTLDGVVDQFLGVNFKSITEYSSSLETAIPILQDSIPSFTSFQLYSDWGYLLAYAPGREDGNWAGFSKLTYTKTGEDQLTVGWEGYVYGSWWKKIYYNAGGQMILDFLLDKNGLYVIQDSKKVFYLVSKSDPSQYCLVEL